MFEHHTKFRHHPEIDKVGIALTHPFVGQDADIIVAEVVIGGVAVSLHPEGDLLSTIPCGEEASPCIETPVSLFEVEKQPLSESRLAVDAH